jgi:hypothetical protein
MKKRFPPFRIFLLLIGSSLLITLASYAIPTWRNVHLDPLKEYTTITGETIVNLPCGSPDYPEWHSNDPILPEARGLPFNYHFWNPCYGHQILRNSFLLDTIFWFLLSMGIYYYLTHTKKHHT